jgi:hypothetical protein
MVASRTLHTLLILAFVVCLALPAAGEEESLAVGATLDQVPELLPGGLPPAGQLPEGSLDAAVAWVRAREPAKARRELEAFLGQKRPRDSEWLRACYLYGYLCLLDEDWQLASLHFYRVRSSEHPLAVYALYHEAYVDYRRGKYSAAIPECTLYLERFSNGPHRDSCQMLIADAHREAGHAGTAITLYKEYANEREDEDLDEQIQVAIARAYEVAGNTDVAVRLYTNLLINHVYASNGEAAEEGLARLREAGAEMPVLTDNQLWLHANALKNSYRWSEGYAIFKELMERYEDQPESEFFKKLEANEYAFRWQSRQYGPISLESARKYDAAPNGAGASENLYRAIRGFNKAGDFVNAAKYAEIALKRYGGSGRFGGIEQDLAWYYTNGANYAEANKAWQRCYDRRKKGLYRWMVAYTTYRAGQYEQAIDALTALVNGGGTYAQAARFYRAKCYIALDRLGSARADFDAILKEEPHGWYAQVIQSRRRRARRTELSPGEARIGRWPSTIQLVDAEIPVAPQDDPPVGDVIAALAQGPFPTQRWRDEDISPARRSIDGLLLTDDEAIEGDAPPDIPLDWAALVWPHPEVEPAPEVPAVVAAGTHVVYPDAPAGVGYDEAKALLTFAKFVQSYEEIWPELGPVYELARLGYREDAGLLMNAIFLEIKDAQKSRKIARAVTAYEQELADEAKKAAEAAEATVDEDPDAGPSAEKVEPVKVALLPPLREEERWKRMREIRSSGTAWRDLFILSGDPHHMLTFSSGGYRMPTAGKLDPDALASWRQRYPLAYGPQVWRLCKELDLDPMMIFGLMRQESTYHPTIVSHAGAVGVMQIMPGTGAKVAVLSGYGSYSNDRLREPEVNIYFGIWYLSRLMARFDGQYPLAIGSYNGGPHNIGRWLRSKHGVGMEEFVEEIPFNETRDYVKKVVRNYGIYMAIHDPEAYVQLERTTRPDNPEVINF